MALSLKKLTTRKPVPAQRLEDAPQVSATPSAGAADVVQSGSEQGPGAADRVLVITSSILLPVGLLAIVLAWYGAAHTPYLFEQVPYLISGGLLGLALVVAAGVCYVGSWVTRSARDQRAAGAELLAVLAEIRDGLAEVAASPAAAPVPARRRGAAKTSVNGDHAVAPRLVATASGSMLHRPDCAVVVSRPDVRDVSESTSGLAPCRLCDPLSSIRL